MSSSFRRPVESRDVASLEIRLLRARAQGEISADASFEQLYGEYERLVSAWLAVRAEWRFVEDLAQDVWLIFYGRWRKWEYRAETQSEDARPVLAFLFRTCRFVALGHRRLDRKRPDVSASESKDEPASQAGPEQLLRRLEAGRCLSLARELCPEEEFDVLVAKLSGMKARDIAQAMSLSESIVDHRYRSALGRLRKKMKLDKNRENRT